MTDLPDRLAINPKSPFFDQGLLARGVGIRFNGQEKTGVEEYCISEGWIRIAVGKTMARDGSPMTMKLSGRVAPYLRDEAGQEPAGGDPANGGGVPAPGEPDGRD